MIKKYLHILLRNWKFDWNEKVNADKEEINNYSEDIDIADYWKIILREWEVNEIIFKADSSSGFHLKTKPTCKQIKKNGLNGIILKNQSENFILIVKYANK